MIIFITLNIRILNRLIDCQKNASQNLFCSTYNPNLKIIKNKSNFTFVKFEPKYI